MNIPCGNKTLDLSTRTHIMGILNVTPDSFSDGGDYLDPILAKDRAQQMIQYGADIIDIGGESTRPGSDPVSVNEELRRVIPVIRSLANSGVTNISIDTRRAEVAQKALDAGASWINDVSALRDDPNMRHVIHKADAIVLMHRQGASSKIMQQDPQYQDVVLEVAAMLHEQVRIAEHHGMALSRIILDPGIGFGKTLEHNLELTRRLGEILGCDLSPCGRGAADGNPTGRGGRNGYPILYGSSRKKFLGALTGIKSEKDRDIASLASMAVAVRNGASIVRVHNVKICHEFLTVLDAL